MKAEAFDVDQWIDVICWGYLSVRRTIRATVGTLTCDPRHFSSDNCFCATRNGAELAIKLFNTHYQNRVGSICRED